MGDSREELLKRFQSNMGAEITEKAQGRLNEKAEKWGCSIELVKYIEGLEERLEEMNKTLTTLKKST